jgi:sporulation protein YlmC with PRC-barrel domain
MGVRRVSELLAVPITHNGIELGRPVDVLFDLSRGRTLGLEVRCRDDAHRFVPLGAARLGRDASELASPLALLDDVAFYRARGAAFRELRGLSVERDGTVAGMLGDVTLAEDGTIESLLVETPSGWKRLAFGPGVSLVGDSRASAA